MAEQTISFDILASAVNGSAAAFRCRTKLQPAGGEGDKVFPPTYAGAVYATERRRYPDRQEPVECVLLDSVQSQANRMEDALQAAVDDGRLTIPLIKVDFEGIDLLDEIRRITSLTAPHRIADAILRDSLHGGTPFRQSDDGQAIVATSLANATSLYQLCPTALLFGMWDSTGPKGGLGAKFQRAIVSEIVGIDAVYGVQTSSRIDPLQIRSAVKVVKSENGSWSIAKDAKEKGALSPSEVNHGNIPPTFSKYVKGAEGRDPLHPSSVQLEYRVQTKDENLVGMNRFTSLESEARQGAIAPGGVTIAFAEQTVTLSLPAIRRLRFPLESAKGNTEKQAQVDKAGQTVLAALGLCAAALAAEKGFDLRSRCLLWPTEVMEWELLDKPGESKCFGLDANAGIALLNEAVAAAEKLGLTWRGEPLVLRPSPQLVELVRRSQELAAVGGAEAEDD